MAWTALHKVCEDELKPRAVELRKHVECLCRAADPAVRSVDSDGDDAVVSYTQIDSEVACAAPYQTQVRNRKLSLLPIVPFSVLNAVYVVNAELSFAQFKFAVKREGKKCFES